MTEWGLAEKIGGGVAALLTLVFTLQRLMTFWKKERVDQSNADAVNAQFRALQESIIQHTKELESLRATVNIMDRTIHRQQKTITRLEVLVLQMKGLMAGAGVMIPPMMQREIDDLVKDQD